MTDGSQTKIQMQCNERYVELEWRLIAEGADFDFVLGPANRLPEALSPRQSLPSVIDHNCLVFVPVFAAQAKWISLGFLNFRLTLTVDTYGSRPLWRPIAK